jgi:hypothetical protein
VVGLLQCVIRVTVNQFVSMAGFSFTFVRAGQTIVNHSSIGAEMSKYL